MMISVDEAWDRIRSAAQPLSIERRSLDSVAGSVLAEEVIAPMDLPPFDNSAMDGYALRAADTQAARAEQPVILPVLGEVAAGGWRAEPVSPGSSVKIMTGAAVPAGADAVLMLEDGRLHQGAVEIRAAVPLGKHIRRKGEDVRQGEVICQSGLRLNAQRLGLLASSGIAEVAVVRRARVAVLATGSELAQPGTPLAPGQIYDSNRLVLRTLLQQTGSCVDDLGVAPDDPARIRERIQAGLSADLLLISGGVSVGAHDHVKQVLRDLGVETLFWRVAMKPGKPILCGRRDGTWVFGLPGNPISCVVGFLVFIEPLLRLLQGEAQARPRYGTARLTRAVSKKDGRTPSASGISLGPDSLRCDRRHFMTARLALGSDGVMDATPTAKQGSAMMQALAEANGFVVVPEAVCRLEADELVDVLPLGGEPCL
jgi:molybdopterin molybdotransferase